jgi:steroid delta-isomerase-like uncharacterized protein
VHKHVAEGEQRRVSMRALVPKEIDGGRDRRERPEYVGPQGGTGPASFRVIVVGLRTSFPDIHYAVDDAVAERDRVAVRWHWTGTHKAPFRGFPATGRAVVNSGAGIFRLEGGKIVEAALETDRLGFLEQIGVVPEGVGRGPRPADTPARPPDSAGR